MSKAAHTKPARWLLFCAVLMAVARAAHSADGQLYTPGPIDGVEISGAADVRYVQGASDQVFVDGDEAVQKALAMDLHDGLLTIRSAGAWKFWNAQRVRITVTTRQLTRLIISGAADFRAAAPVLAQKLAVSISGAGLARFDQLQADELSFNVSGAGDGQVSGSVQTLDIKISGRSDFRGDNLMSQRARVSVSGIGKVMVWAVQDLTVNVAGIGTVDHWGSAKVQRRTSGVARINDRGDKAVPAAP
jgi:hypothetical protein